jgi:electron transport complex protein RnfA
MSAIFDMITMALYTCLLRNVIFTGGFGATESVRMAAKPKYLFHTSGFIVYFSVLVALICRTVDIIPAIRNSSIIIHAIVYTLVLFSLYIATCVGIKAVFKTDEKLIKRVGVAALNTLVMSVPFINRLSASTVPDSLGLGIGAGLAYIIAVSLINVGLRYISRSRSIPDAFKGVPAVLIYVALLSMAFTGISGKALSL